MFKDTLKEYIKSRDFFTFDFQVSFEKYHEPSFKTYKGGCCSLWIYMLFGFLFLNKLLELGKGGAVFNDN